MTRHTHPNTFPALSFIAGEIEAQREARKSRVKEIRLKRGGGPPPEPDPPPKPEPKPGVRLSRKEVFEIIAARKAKAQAKAKTQALNQRGRPIMPPVTGAKLRGKLAGKVS